MSEDFMIKNCFCFVENLLVDFWVGWVNINDEEVNRCYDVIWLFFRFFFDFFLVLFLGSEVNYSYFFYYWCFEEILGIILFCFLMLRLYVFEYCLKNKYV